MAKKKHKPQKKRKLPKATASNQDTLEKLQRQAYLGLQVLEKYNDPIKLDERYRPIIGAIANTAVSPTHKTAKWGLAFLAKQLVLAAYVLGRDRKRPQVPLDNVPFYLIAQIKDLDDDDNANELSPLATSLWATLISKKLQNDPAGKQASAFNHIYVAYRIGTNRRIKTYEQRTGNK